MPASSSSPAGAAASILLVEEYGALAVAIGSALRKFAPACRTIVVGSLAEAETAAAESRPQLLVIDFDPPPAQAVAFFEKIRTTIPDARVLVMGPGLSREMLPLRSKAAGFQFIDKPFDLAELGLAVQSLLGPRHSAGTLGDISVADLLPLLCAAGVSTTLTVQATGRRAGEIHLSRGQITHAKTSGWTGFEALCEMLGWRSPRCAETDAESDAPRTIRGRWQSILSDALQEPDAGEPPPLQPVAGKAAGPQATPAGKKVVVIDDTEMLLLFVDEILATSDATLQIKTAASGTEGVRRVTDVLPDLVLLDYSLPDITGNEVCQRLLAMPQTANIPVIMMSGHVPEMTATAERFGNVVATIAKPFLSHQLVGLVTKTLANPPPVNPRPQPKPEAKRPTPAAPPPAPPQRQKPQTPPQIPVAKVPPSPASLPFPTVMPPVVPPQPAVRTAAVAAPIPFAAPATSHATTTLKAPTRAITKPVAAAALPGPLARVHIPAAKSNSVLLSIPLEVVAMQFSPTLQMAAIRARPCSAVVSLHIEPGTLAGVVLPEAGFEMAGVKLDGRGQIEVVRLSPTAHPRTILESRSAFGVAGLTILPANGGKTMQLVPAAATAMTMQLEAPFELAGVELSASFGVRHLVLKARGGRMRVSLHPQAAHAGATFETAQVLLNRAGRIDEILLDAVAAPGALYSPPQLAAMP